MIRVAATSGPEPIVPKPTSSFWTQEKKCWVMDCCLCTFEARALQDKGIILDRLENELCHSCQKVLDALEKQLNKCIFLTAVNQVFNNTLDFHLIPPKYITVPLLLFQWDSIIKTDTYRISKTECRIKLSNMILFQTMVNTLAPYLKKLWR